MPTPPHTTRKNLINLILLVGVLLPPILVTRQLGRHSDLFAFALDWWHRQPLVFVNILLFIHLDVTFWLISLVQKSTWLIDPYWCIVPLCLAHYYHHWAAHHNTAGFLRYRDPNWRWTIAIVLLYLWAARLFHTYIRREKWQLGAREDWRFTDMREQIEQVTWRGRRIPGLWPLLSFPLAYLSQHVFLFGVSLPFFDIAQGGQGTRTPPVDAQDWFAAGVVLFGLWVAYVADRELYNFVRDRHAERARGDDLSQHRDEQLVLQNGLWGISRHPNYLGEILVWTGFGLFSCRLGQPVHLWGAALNALCLFIVSFMVEEKMNARPERKAAYGRYCAKVSRLFPSPLFVCQGLLYNATTHAARSAVEVEAGRERLVSETGPSTARRTS